jgi:hypothetical protein
MLMICRPARCLLSSIIVFWVTPAVSAEMRKVPPLPRAHGTEVIVFAKGQDIWPNSNILQCMILRRRENVHFGRLTARDSCRMPAICTNQRPVTHEFHPPPPAAPARDSRRVGPSRSAEDH